MRMSKPFLEPEPEQEPKALCPNLGKVDGKQFWDDITANLTKDGKGCCAPIYKQIFREGIFKLPPLDHDALELLQASIKKYGCTDPLIVWKGTDILVDGWARFDLCRTLKKAYSVLEMDFANEAEVLEFILIRNAGRRHLTAWQRLVIFARYKDTIAAQAKENQRLRGLDPTRKEAIHTSKKLAQICGCSKSNIDKMLHIEQHGTKNDHELLTRNEASVDKIYKKLRDKEDKAGWTLRPIEYKDSCSFQDFEERYDKEKIEEIVYYIQQRCKGHYEDKMILEISIKVSDKSEIKDIVGEVMSRSKSKVIELKDNSVEAPQPIEQNRPAEFISI